MTTPSYNSSEIDLIEELTKQCNILRQELDMSQKEYALVKTKIMNALYNGMDEELWHPGEFWIEATLRAIETAKDYYQVDQVNKKEA